MSILATLYFAKNSCGRLEMAAAGSETIDTFFRQSLVPFGKFFSSFVSVHWEYDILTIF